MNLILFIIVLCISFIIVRIGAIAFELTGLDWSVAKFQALSCFSGTGFTTKESELIINHPQRRKIASFLIVLGNAGLVTLIATFANSLRPSSLVPKLEIPLLKLFIPSSLLPWINFIVIVLSAIFIFRLFSNTKFIFSLTEYLKKVIIRKEIIKPFAFRELIFLAKGYGVSKIKIYEKNSALDKTLSNSGLKQKDIIVLAIERKNKIIPNPPISSRISLHDQLICFGKIHNMKKFH